VSALPSAVAQLGLVRSMRAALLHLISAIIGGAVGALLVVWLVLPDYGRQKEQFGRSQGYAQGQVDFALKIPVALGDDFSKTEKYTLFHQVKDIDVVVVERNGVKTLRLYPPH
jgi:hypothetical protein